MWCDLHNPTISRKTKGKQSQKYEKWDFGENLFETTYTFMNFLFPWNLEICTMGFTCFSHYAKWYFLALPIGKYVKFFQKNIMAMQNDAETPKIWVIPIKTEISAILFNFNSQIFRLNFLKTVLSHFSTLKGFSKAICDRDNRNPP